MTEFIESSMVTFYKRENEWFLCPGTVHNDYDCKHVKAFTLEGSLMVRSDDNVRVYPSKNRVRCEIIGEPNYRMALCEDVE